MTNDEIPFDRLPPHLQGMIRSVTRDLNNDLELLAALGSPVSELSIQIAFNRRMQEKISSN